MHINKKVLITMVVVFVAALAFGGYVYYEFSTVLSNRKAEIVSLDQSIQELRGQRGSLETELENARNEIEDLQEDKTLLVDAFRSERQQTQEFQERLQDMSEEVEDFKKLQDIDEEVLKKYSKTFFLNENYEPSSLTQIEEEYLYFEDEPEEIHADVYPLLVGLIDAARGDGIELYVRSGYRSFGEQTSLKNEYEVIYGEGSANSFSAEQGYSEHQLGTTIDFTTPELNGSLDGFENTEGYQWLLENAYKYGFVLSYPEGNDYYVFEPWHWRFVGQELASDLEAKDMHFYEMDQRELDEYLLKVFD